MAASVFASPATARTSRTRSRPPPAVGYVDGPGVATKDTLYWGFGLEGVTDAAKRAQLIKDAMAYLGAG